MPTVISSVWGNSRIILLSVFLMLLGLSVTIISAYGEIKKRTRDDGTIDFFNTKKSPSPKEKRHSFSSAYDPIIQEIASREGLDPYLIKCIIKAESDFNPNAISPAGAMGLMQLMQEVTRLYNMKDPFDPRENISTGVKHFKVLMKYFNDDIPLALAAYHAGLGRVKKRMAVPPIRATIDYVNRIMMYYTGKKPAGTEKTIQRLYKRIEKDGTIVIYGR